MTSGIPLRDLLEYAPRDLATVQLLIEMRRRG